MQPNTTIIVLLVCIAGLAILTVTLWRWALKRDIYRILNEYRETRGTSLAVDDEEAQRGELHGRGWAVAEKAKKHGNMNKSSRKVEKGNGNVKDWIELARTTNNRTKQHRERHSSTNNAALLNPQDETEHCTPVPKESYTSGGWTPLQDATLIDAKLACKSWKDVATEVGKEVGALKVRWAEIKPIDFEKRLAERHAKGATKKSRGGGATALPGSLVGGSIGATPKSQVKGGADDVFIGSPELVQWRVGNGGSSMKKNCKGKNVVDV
jgi:hypothetical protein